MRPSLILTVALRFIATSALVFGLYLLVAGHNQPGGGFVGGLVAGAAVVLTFVAGDLDAVRRLLPLRPWSVLGGGLVVVSAAAIAPIVLGGDVLGQDFAEVSLPVAGTVKLTSSIVFDTGVFLVVVGLVLMTFEALGEPLPPDQADPWGDDR